MPDILIRNVSATTVEQLKSRAAAHARSLQAEAKTILEQAAEQNADIFRERVSAIRKRLARRRQSNSATMIARDRKK